MSGTRTVRLRYGRSTIELAVPAAAELLEPREPALRLDRDSFRAGLAAELPEPLPSGPIVIVVADKTRLCGYPTVLPWLVELLAERGAGPERITFFIAYGVHARQSEAESLAAYGPVYTRYRFVHHDCDDAAAFVDLGRTGRGTPARAAHGRRRPGCSVPSARSCSGCCARPAARPPHRAPAGRPPGAGAPHPRPAPAGPRR